MAVDGEMKFGYFVRELMRIALSVMLVTTTSVFAFIVPGGEPTTTIIGRVLNTEKFGGDSGKNKIVHWELWKADVKVERVTGTDTNIADKVFIYYTQYGFTNYLAGRVKPNGNPILGLATNGVYEFTCHNHTNIRDEYGIGTETNALVALDGMIVAQ